MSRLRESFRGRKNVFVIAIHVGTDEDAYAADIEVARIEGADGIIVIRDYTTAATDNNVLVAYRYARKKYPRWWIGINLLNHMAHEAVLRIPSGTSGLWVDNPRVEEVAGGTEYIAEVRRSLDVVHLPVPPLFLPSVAFKYQTPVKNFAAVAKLAESFADVVITSGNATGKAPDFEKVKAMRAAIKCPLGLASGVDVGNVQQFIDLGVDLFIVNTSISTEGRLDGNKVCALRRKISR